MTRSRETEGPPAAGTDFPDDAMFRQLADCAPVLMRRSGPDGRCVWVNAPWLDYTGHGLQQALGLGWTESVHPEDRERCLDAGRAALVADQPFSTDIRLRRHDSAYRWFRDSTVPVRRTDGGSAGCFGYAVDVTDRVDLQAAGRRQQSLVDYLNHRMKNTLVMVHSIALQTFRKVPDVDPTLRMFDGRLSAVAASQDLLARRDWRGATLRETAEIALRPFGGLDGSLIEIAGPEVKLSPRQTTALAFALHELGANASRFGALSTGGGRVSLRWEAESTTAGTSFTLIWREQGGPPVVPPARKGFGARMIERGLAQELAGSAEIDFAPGGLVCTIRAKLGPADAEPE